MAPTKPIPAFEDHCWKDLLDDDLLDIYSAYQRPLRVGKNPALLAIDLYNSAYWGGNVPVVEANRKHRGSCGENAWKAIEPTKRLFAAARAAGIPVIYTTRKPDTRGVNSTHRDHGGNALPGDIYDIYEAFPPQPGELIVYKERASGFFGTPLVAHLRLLGCDSVVVCGESTSGCVRASVVDGYSYGYHMTVVEECTFDRSMLSHKVNLFDLHHKYADVMKVDDVLAHLAKMPARKVA